MLTIHAIRKCVLVVVAASLSLSLLACGGGGADPGARAEGGATALHAAALENPDPAVVEALIAGGAQQFSL